MSEADLTYKKAVTFLQEGKGAKARDLLQKNIRKHARHVPSLYTLGTLAMQEKHHAIAENYLARLVELQPDYADAWRNLGIVRFLGLGDTGAASEAFTRAIALDRKQHLAFFYQGLILKNLNAYEEACDMFAHVTELLPDFAPAFMELGLCWMYRQDFDKAKNDLLKSYRLKPDDITIAFNLLVLMDIVGDDSNFSDELRAAMQGHAFSDLFEAFEARRTGDNDRALTLFSKIDTTGHPQIEIYRLFALGHLYDRKKRCAEAFEAFEKANKLEAQTPQAQTLDGQVYLDMLARLKRYQPSIKTDDDYAQAPCFIVGFPRSGTTLVGQILNAHPDIHVTDEEPVIEWLRMAMQDEFSLSYPDDLGRLSDTQLQQLRAMFFDKHRASPRWRDSKVFVDKLPSNMVHAPFIQTLFPKAKIIYVQRHPIDTVLSGFMQQFKLNHLMVHALDLGDWANMYREFHEIWCAHQPHLKTPVHEVRYESLVTDFKETVAALLSFIDVEWDENVMRFYKQPSSAPRTLTPSRTQVTQKIYDHAKGRWHGYRDFIGDVPEKLADVVTQIGYQ